MKGVIPVAGSLLIFTWLSIGSVQGLKCYTCQYIDGMLETDTFGEYMDHESDWYGKSCHTSEQPSARFLETCKPGYTCAKISLKGRHSKTGEKVVATLRGCAERNVYLSGKCHERSSSYSFCFCDSDRCNNARSMLPPFYGLVASVISIFIAGRFM